MNRRAHLLACAAVAAAIAGCSGSSSSSDGQGNAAGCGKIRPAVAQALHDIQDHVAGRTTAAQAAAQLHADEQQIDATKPAAKSAALRTAVDGVSAQVGVYAISLDINAHSAIAGTGKKFFQPFDKLAALCTNGSS